MITVTMTMTITMTIEAFDRLDSLVCRILAPCTGECLDYSFTLYPILFYCILLSARSFYEVHATRSSAMIPEYGLLSPAFSLAYLTLFSQPSHPPPLLPLLLSPLPSSLSVIALSPAEDARLPTVRQGKSHAAFRPHDAVHEAGPIPASIARWAVRESTARILLMFHPSWREGVQVPPPGGN